MDDAMVFSLADSVSRDKGMHYGLLRLGLEPEKLPAVPQFGLVFTCDIVRSFAEFHLAKVDDAVCTLDNVPRMFRFPCQRYNARWKRM